MNKAIFSLNMTIHWWWAEYKIQAVVSTLIYLLLLATKEKEDSQNFHQSNPGQRIKTITVKQIDHVQSIVCSEQ